MSRTSFRPASRIAATASLLGFLVLGVLLFAGRSAIAADPKQDLLTPAEREWLAAHPRIVLGAGEDWAPSVMKDAQGQISGFIVDHMALLNRKLGTDMRIEAGPWNEMVRKAEAGEIDGLTLTAPLEERRNRFLFTDVFFTVYDFLFLRTADLSKPSVPTGLEDLDGKRVGYLKGTLRISRALSGRPGVTAVAADSYGALAQMLLAGEIDVAISSYSLEYWRASNGVMGLSPTRIVPDTEARMVMTIRKDRAQLVSILNKGLAAITKDELEPLFRRWFGADYLDRAAKAGGTLTTEELAWLAAHPVLRAAIDPAWAPVEFTDAAGVPRGISVAYLERLGRILGVRFEVDAKLSWSEALRRLGAREVDVLPAIVATPEREQRMLFTGAYLSLPAVIFSAADVAYLGGPSALAGKSVAVVRDEAVYPWLEQEWPDVKLIPVADTVDGLKKVAGGEAFAFIGNLVTTSYYIGQSGLTQIKVAGETSFTYRLAMGVRGDWPILARILQKALDTIPASERNAIYNEWISIQYKHSVDYSLLWWLAAAAGLILLAVFAERTRALRRANARLKQLANEMSLVEERERQRLARELHDSPMQKLALAQIHIGAASRHLGDRSDDRFATGLDLMRESLDELRSLQFELSPPMLYQEGLAPTLRWLASYASERFGVPFSFREGSRAPQIQQDLAVLLFQCARELVYNVAKHSGASAGVIDLAVDDSGVTVTVTDNGEGFASDVESQGPSRKGGFGLLSVRERLALHGGTLTIESSDSGTKAVVHVPAAGEDRAERADVHAAHPPAPSRSGSMLATE
jgi:signal transduction histidine kinase